MSKLFKVRRKHPKVSKSVSGLVKRAQEIQAQLDTVKPLYSELDEITQALVAVRTGLAKYGVTVVDNFEAKNTVFKATGVKRFELRWGSK